MKNHWKSHRGPPKLRWKGRIIVERIHIFWLIDLVCRFFFFQFTESETNTLASSNPVVQEKGKSSNRIWNRHVRSNIFLWRVFGSHDLLLKLLPLACLWCSNQIDNFAVVATSWYYRLSQLHSHHQNKPPPNQVPVGRGHCCIESGANVHCQSLFQLMVSRGVSGYSDLFFWIMEIRCSDSYVYMDVSENSGTPKSSILIGFSIINHPFWGTPILETPIYIYM